MANDSVQIKIGQTIPRFVELMQKPGVRQAFPNVMRALNDLADMYVETWRRFAMGGNLPGTSQVISVRGGDKYIQSIKADKKNATTKVISADGKTTDAIEKGHDAIDLKPGLLKGPKHRNSKKDGGAYNIVAFRHGTPGTLPSNKPMPMQVFNLSNRMEQSRVIGTYTDQGGVKRNEHKWGGRLPAAKGGAPQTKKISPAMQKELSKRYGTAVGDEYTWKAGKHANMVRMQANTAKAKSSSYITFRCVSIHSDPASWIVPEKQGVPIRDAVVKFMKGLTEDMIKDAFEEDLASGKPVQTV